MDTLDSRMVGEAFADPDLVKQLEQQVAAAQRALAASRRQLDQHLHLAAQVHRTL